MGIRVICKTKNKETLKLANHLRSYLFEQECGELKSCTHAQKKALKDSLAILDSMI